MSYLPGGAHLQRNFVEARLQALNVLRDLCGHAAVQGVLHKAFHKLRAVAAAHQNVFPARDEFHVPAATAGGSRLIQEYVIISLFKRRKSFSFKRFIFHGC